MFHFYTSGTLVENGLIKGEVKVYGIVSQSMQSINIFRRTAGQKQKKTLAPHKALRLIYLSFPKDKYLFKSITFMRFEYSKSTTGH